jgi:hypothetical protein
MPGERHREEVLNTVLATCLGRLGMSADPETILDRGRSRPDVIATFRGLRCAIEGKVVDTPSAETVVLADAKGRIEQGIAHVAIAAVYPTVLRITEFALLPSALGSAILRFTFLTEAGDGAWHSGGINDILAELRRAHDILVRDDVLQQAVDTLNIGLSEVASALVNNRGACDRLIQGRCHGNLSRIAENLRGRFPLMPPLPFSRCQMPRL